MNCLQTFLKCSQFVTDPTYEEENIDELSEAIAEKCENFLKGKHSSKCRLEYIDKYMRNEICMLDEPIPSPNVDHILEVAIDKMLDQIHF